MNASPTQKVPIITGASQGIGAGLVEGYRKIGFAVVGTAQSIRPSTDPGYVTLPGDITEADTAQRVVELALTRFGRIDSLINDAGVYIGKPFTGLDEQKRAVRCEKT
jgi:NADP-dependent 3-hydroxy acid dehydrogenase YdfG